MHVISTNIFQVLTTYPDILPITELGTKELEPGPDATCFLVSASLTDCALMYPTVPRMSSSALCWGHHGIRNPLHIKTVEMPRTSTLSGSSSTSLLELVQKQALDGFCWWVTFYHRPLPKTDTKRKAVSQIGRQYGFLNTNVSRPQTHTQNEEKQKLSQTFNDVRYFSLTVAHTVACNQALMLFCKTTTR